jgi:hypothetical protein
VARSSKCAWLADFRYPLYYFLTTRRDHPLRLGSGSGAYTHLMRVIAV